LTLSSYVKSEEEANKDFIYGEGFSARQAAASAAAEAKYTKWAEENPEEAAKQYKKWERQWAAEERANERKVDWGSYSRGRKAAEKISIDQQMGATRAAGRLK
jgi:hypothetical protein